MGPRIGLVLGGGGSRGIAHAGVLQVLVREGIPIDLIVGTSMGGIIGALFALGLTPARLIEEMKEMEGSSLIHVSHLGTRARQRMLRDMLADPLEDKRFADLQIPLALMTVDMVEGKEIALTEGPLLPAVLATAALPGLFPPVEMNGAQLADGGVIDSLATHVAFEQGANKIIAVDVDMPLDEGEPWADPLSGVMGIDLPFGLLSSAESDGTPNMLSSMWRGVRVMAAYIHRRRLEEAPPDVLLRPDLRGCGSLSFDDLEDPLRAGVVEAEKHLTDLKALAGQAPVDVRLE